MSAIENWYKENPNVIIMTNLDDIGQPYSCEQWGDRHQDFDAIPIITDDGPQDIIWGWLHTGGAFPSTAYLDHTMTVYFKANNPSFSIATGMIDDMLDECGDLCTLGPPMALFEYMVDGNSVTFIDLSEFASEGWIISDWNWDFGDGNTSSEQNPTHTYDSDGTYSVSLSITTDIGIESDPYTENITIGNLNISDSNDMDFGISKNYPNPFNPNTVIKYDLNHSGYVEMNVYDISGNLIEELVDGYYVSGQHEYNWTPSNLSSGMYYIHLIQGNQSDQMKVMYIK